MHHERHDGGILVTTDPARLDLDTVHDFLAGSSYWAKGVPREVMERSIRHSTKHTVARMARPPPTQRRSFGRKSQPASTLTSSATDPTTNRLRTAPGASIP